VFLANVRNPSMIFFGLAFPIIFIGIFGLIGQGDAQFEVALRQDSLRQSPISQALNEIEAIEITDNRTEEEIDEALLKGQLPAAITIREVTLSGLPNYYEVLLETSGADQQNAATVRSIIDNLVQSANNPPSQEGFKTVDLQIKEVQGRKYSQIDFILPGQLSFALLSTGVFGTAFSFITLRKTLVLKRMFATPSPRWIILGSKILSSLIVSLIQAVVIIAVGYFFFNFTLVNGWQTFGEMVLLSVFGLLVFLGFGLLVASLANSEDSASPVANLITLPQFILSGAFFPTELFPEFLQPFANALPMSFLNAAMRTVAFEGGGLITVWQPIAWLVVWALVVYIPTIKLFRWE